MWLNLGPVVILDDIWALIGRRAFLASGSCRERRRCCSSLSLSRSALSSPSLLSLLLPSRRSELDCVRNARTHARIASCYRLYFPSVLMIFLFPSFINLLRLSFVSEIDPGEKELCNNQSEAACLELLSLFFPFLLFWVSGSLLEAQYWSSVQAHECKKLAYHQCRFCSFSGTAWRIAFFDWIGYWVMWIPIFHLLPDDSAFGYWQKHWWKISGGCEVDGHIGL